MLSSHLLRRSIPKQVSSDGRLPYSKCTQSQPVSCKLRILMQSRSFYGGPQNNWVAHLDPLVSRALRYRTIKTKAKLLEKLRRRGKFDWDASQRPFFSSQKYIRWASHYQGRSPRGKWPQNSHEETTHARVADDADAVETDAGAEWSDREQKWREHMDALRKRVEQDPYGAVFGKRFEPFWGPLLPKWMKHDLDTSPAKPDTHSFVAQNKRNVVAEEQDHSSITYNAAKTPTIHASAIATSWSSWTDKTQRVKWDSDSGVTTRYEYDPISNRMVQVSPQSTDGKDIGASEESTSVLPRMSDESETKAKKPLINASKPQSPADIEIGSLTANRIRSAMGRVKPLPTDNSVLQTSISRVKPDISTNRAVDADDSAAHESTEPVLKTATIPQKWSEQSDILQSARVSRTSSPHPYALAQTVEMNTRSARPVLSASELRNTSDLLEDSAEMTQLRESNTKLRNDVDTQKNMLLIHQERSANKIRDLREELDIAYRQSSTHAAAHVDRIKTLGKAVVGAREDKGKVSSLPTLSEVESRGEGDVCQNVMKFANNDQWYKRPVNVADNALLKEPGRIKAVHSIRDAKLQKALNEHEQPTAYEFECDNLARELSISPGLARKNADKQYSFVSETSTESLPTTQTGKPILDEQRYDFEGTPQDITCLETNPHSAKPAIKTYAFQKDSLEDELCENEISEKSSNDSYSYPFKADRKSSASPSKPRAATAEPQNYIFQPDLLEAETPNALSLPATEESRYQYENYDLPRSFSAGANKSRETGDKKVEQALDASDTSSGRSHTYRLDGLEKDLRNDSRSKPIPETKETYQFTPEKEMDRKRELDQSSLVLKDQNYQFKQDTLSEEIAEEERQVQEALAEVSLQDSSSSDTISRSGVSNIEWEEPPLYKVLAYDSGNDLMSTAITSSNVTSVETPMSISDALAKVYQPARFVPHFTELQREGFQAIYGRADLLIFRKVKSAEAACDHGLIVNEDYASIVDHGLTVPKENAAAQEAANFYDRYRFPRQVNSEGEEHNAERRAAINPIDLMRSHPDIRPSTGNFASPTGFVNYDPIFPTEEPFPEKNETSRNGASGTGAKSGNVRRTEPVFSGASRSRGPLSQQQRAEERREWREERRRNRRRGAGALRWALSVGVTSAAFCYVIGVAAEASRKERREQQR